ncbi:MAG: hypothetical protein IT488_10560 [Gammaproteobacteria bacterium]|nr:hypothetical protein [Gammaproteobacteria bacterium]
MPAQGFFPAQGFALQGCVSSESPSFCFVAHGFLPAQGFAAIWLDRAAQGFAALHGAANAAPLMAAANAPDESRDFVNLLNFKIIPPGRLVRGVQVLVAGASEIHTAIDGNVFMARRIARLSAEIHGRSIKPRGSFSFLNSCAGVAGMDAGKPGSRRFIAHQAGSTHAG